MLQGLKYSKMIKASHWGRLFDCIDRLFVIINCNLSASDFYLFLIFFHSCFCYIYNIIHRGYCGTQLAKICGAAKSVHIPSGMLSCFQHCVMGVFVLIHKLDLPYHSKHFLRQWWVG